MSKIALRLSQELWSSAHRIHLTYYKNIYESINIEYLNKENNSILKLLKIKMTIYKNLLNQIRNKKRLT